MLKRYNVWCESRATCFDSSESSSGPHGVDPYKESSMHCGILSALGIPQCIELSLYGSTPWGPEDDSLESKHVALLSHHTSYLFSIYPLSCWTDLHPIILYKHFGMEHLKFQAYMSSNRGEGIRFTTHSYLALRLWMSGIMFILVFAFSVYAGATLLFYFPFYWLSIMKWQTERYFTNDTCQLLWLYAVSGRWMKYQGKTKVPYFPAYNAHVIYTKRIWNHKKWTCAVYVRKISDR